LKPELADRPPTARRPELPSVSPEAGSWPATTESGCSMVARRSAVVEGVPQDITDSNAADSIRRRAPSPPHWASRIRLMMVSLGPDRRLFK
jgi:hypothetical protein